MIQIKEKYNCCGCQACAQACPKGCIAMKTDKEGFLYPVVDETACVRCGLCEKVCPILQNGGEKQGIPKAYAAYNRDEEVRLVSSSGGIFTLLAEHILDRNGTLYGAVMEGIHVKHIRVSDSEGLVLLRGSKYVQSDIGRTYIQAKTDLDTGRDVLFTGTPCQIEGLKSYLRKDYENLITMDIICHGVPSPMVWEKYVALREKAAGAPAARMFFRHKKYGWKTYAVLFEFSNKTAYDRHHRDDPFMRAFLHNLCLRPSCYHCGFKKVNRVSDITVADFWGIQNVCPDMDDDKGTSLVIVHSEKGEVILKALSEKMNCREVDFKKATQSNSAMICSAAVPKHRTKFMEQVHHEDFEVLVHRYAQNRCMVKRIARKVLAATGLLETAKKLKKRLQSNKRKISVP